MINGIGHLTAGMYLLKLNTVGVKPLAVGMLRSETLLDFTVVVDFAFLSVNEQHLTRLQTSLLSDDGRIEVHHTHLRGHNHRTGLGYGVTGRTQTITVEHATGITAVTEEKGGRTVPRLHQDRMVLIEGFQIF